MARNEEKSMSMLFRFREAQAAELGLSRRTDKRPRAPRSVNDIRQCERWRGEILREISRKVSKIQDAGINAYEIRDLNDEINNLLREKSNWESQIIALGGANYKRSSIKSYDADGKEVPNIRGYKYFGRAKELPGVKELFEASGAIKKSSTEDEDGNKTYAMFVNPPPNYYGDIDEKNPQVLEEEHELELREWNMRFEELAEEHGLTETPPFPEMHFVPFDSSSTADAGTDPTDDSNNKKRKNAASSKTTKKAKATASKSTEQTAGNGFTTVLDPEELKAPSLLAPEAFEKYIVAKQKAVLLAEYVDDV